MTAVDWMIEQMMLRKQQGLTVSFYDLEMFAEQAKEMEKEQIINAFDMGFGRWNDGVENYLSAEQYYNKTFKPEQDESKNNLNTSNSIGRM